VCDLETSRIGALYIYIYIYIYIYDISNLRVNRKVYRLINCDGMSQGREPTSQNCSEESSIPPFSTATTQTRNEAGKCPNCYPHQR